MLDIVVPCRQGENEELRYALRSWAANLPHRRLVVAGGRPDWYGGEFIEVPKPGGKYLSALANLNALLAADDLTDDVIVCMDDTYVTSPIDEVPALHRGPMVDVMAYYETRHPTSPYTAAMQETYSELVKRYARPNPLSFALHTPMVVNRTRLRELLDDIQVRLGYWRENNRARLQWRTIYGNMFVPEAKRFDDVKVYDLAERWQWPTPFLSTCDASFRDGAVGRHIRTSFPTRCSYEMR